MLEKISQDIPTLENKEIILYRDKFLKDLSEDHPGVAKDISTRTENWKRDVDDKSDTEGFGQAIIDSMVYISKKEIAIFIDSILEEVREIWSENPERAVRFVVWGKENKSGRWFYEMIRKCLSEEENKRDLQVQSFREVKDAGSKSIEPVYFYTDDSANSGQQLKQGVYAFRGLIRSVGNGDIDVDKDKMRANPIDVRLRLMRMTEPVQKFVKKQQKFFQYADDVLVNMDMDGNRRANITMPDIDQALEILNISREDVKRSSLFFQGHHGREPATLGVFWHKVQDNMPSAIIHGRLSQYLPPLITAENIDQIRVQYN